MPQPKVYVVHLPYRRSLSGHPVPAVNIDAAARYGEFVRVINTTHKLPHDLSPLIPTLTDGLRDFGPDDYLLHVGDQGALAIAMALVAHKLNGRVKVLRWQYDISDYTDQELVLW